MVGWFFSSLFGYNHIQGLLLVFFTSKFLLCLNLGKECMCFSCGFFFCYISGCMIKFRGVV